MVYGNFFFKPAGATWEKANGVVGGWTSNSAFHNAKVYNNSFINVDQESLSSFPQTFSGNEAYNNIFYNSQARNFSKFASHDSNLLINSGTVQGEPNGKTGTTNPFVDLVARNFRLTGPTATGKTFAAPVILDPLVVTRGSDGNGIAVPSPAGVSHSLVVKAYDAAGNVGTSSTVVVNARSTQ